MGLPSRKPILKWAYYPGKPILKWAYYPGKPILKWAYYPGKPILKWAFYPEMLLPHGHAQGYLGLLWKIEPKSGFRNSKIPKMGLMIQESSQSLHRLLVERETCQNPDFQGKSKNWQQTYDPEMSKSNMDCWGNQAEIRII